ncbi:MAG: B12-binding domain-containing radical SAM protein [Bacteroidetes bacterium]|nr:B12-binding domain-containing radical SAM protein [Bacteroidota bacterium]
MKVLLVGNPRTVMGFNRLTKLPSLNLASLASNVEEDLAEIKVADLVLKQRNSAGFLQQIIEDFKPDVVGFTAMSFQYQTALKLIKLTKTHSENIITILGGYHATADGETILEGPDHRFIDYIIDGEGEVSFNALLKVLKNKGSISEVPGLLYRQSGRVIKNPRAELLPPDKIRIPDRGSRLIQKGFHILGQPADVIETSRGCVYDCNFCSIRHMYGKSFRKFSTERILVDLEDAKRFGAKSIFITDDNITLDGRRLQKLCDEIEQARLNLTFAVQASVRGFKKNPDLAEAMAKAGTKIVFLGIENASDSALEFMHKRNQLSSADTLDVVKQLKKFGIIVVGGFIFGYPDDNEKTLLENFQYAKKLGIDIQLFNILTPHLKTELREDLLKQGMITNPHDYTKYNHYASNVRTHHLSSEELYRLRNKLDARFPVESGAIFRLMRAYPSYFGRLILKMVVDEPRNWINFTTGFITKRF